MSFFLAVKSGSWLNASRARGYPRLFLCLYILMGFLWVFGLHEKMLPHEGALVTDFMNVYSAGVAAHEGKPEAAYDWQAHKNMQDDITKSLSRAVEIKDTGFLPWAYPPMFLAIGWLAAHFPYFIALGLYSIVGFAFYMLAVGKLAPRFKESLWIAAAFPGAFVNLFSGQNGFLTAGLLAAGLFLIDHLPIAAGMAFGALSYKPQFFILIPLVLAVGKYWKVLFWTFLSASAFAVLSLAVFGFEPWQAFVEGMPATKAQILEINSARWLGILHSVFSAVRVYGGSLQTAYAAQTIVSGVVIAALLWIWHRPSSIEVRGSALAAALLLASPYSFVYDQVLLAIPLALLGGKGLRDGFLPYEKTFLFALWLLPFLVQDSGNHFALPLTPPMLVTLMAFCWIRANNEYPVFIKEKKMGHPPSRV